MSILDHGNKTVAAAVFYDHQYDWTNIHEIRKPYGEGETYEDVAKEKCKDHNLTRISEIFYFNTKVNHKEGIDETLDFLTKREQKLKAEFHDDMERVKQAREELLALPAPE